MALDVLPTVPKDPGGRADQCKVDRSRHTPSTAARGRGALRGLAPAAGLILLMVLIGVLVSVPAALLLQEHHEHDHEDQFERQADAIASNAQDGSMRVLARVDDIADLLSIRGVPNQAEFQRYLRQAGIDADHHLTDLAFIAPPKIGKARWGSTCWGCRGARTRCKR
jgi:hypothetical protein